MLTSIFFKCMFNVERSIITSLIPIQDTKNQNHSPQKVNCTMDQYITYYYIIIVVTVYQHTKFGRLPCQWIHKQHHGIH